MSTIAAIVGIMLGAGGLGSVARLRANLHLADDRADSLEKSLTIERADRIESEDRCTAELARVERLRTLDRQSCEREISRLEGTIAGLTTDTGRLIADAVLHALRSDGSPSAAIASGTIDPDRKGHA